MLKSKISAFISDFSKAVPEKKPLRSIFQSQALAPVQKTQLPRTLHIQENEKEERKVERRCHTPTPTGCASAKPSGNLSDSSQYPAPRLTQDGATTTTTTTLGNTYISLGQGRQPTPCPRHTCVLPQNLRLCINEVVTSQVRGEASCFP